VLVITKRSVFCPCVGDPKMKLDLSRTDEFLYLKRNAIDLLTRLLLQQLLQLQQIVHCTCSSSRRRRPVGLVRVLVLVIAVVLVVKFLHFTV